MSYSGALTVIAAHLVTAGLATTPPFTDVGLGERLTNTRRIDYWYLGDGEPVRLGAVRTFTDEMRSEHVHIRLVIPVPDRSSTLAAAIETQMQALKEDIRHRLIGDAQLGGNCVDSDVGYASAGWADYDGAWARTIDMEVDFDLVDEDTRGQ